jgi:DNA-binding NarL/FixJ family response regulator
MARILIVEDEGLIAFYAESVLTAAGHVVVGVAHTVAQAVSLTETTAPDLVLMDIHLRRGESGVEAARLLQGRASVVFCTAENEPEKIPGVMELAPAGFLKKPYDKDDLVHVAATFRR